MWKFAFVVVFPVLANSLLVIPRDEIIESYKTPQGRNLLTPEQEEFLMELLAADDALLEASSRGIVDDVLQALSGAGSNVRVNIVGGSGIGPQSRPAAVTPIAQQQQPAVNIINPTFTINGGSLEKNSLNSTQTDAIVNMVVNAALSASMQASVQPQLLADISSSSVSATAPKQVIPGTAGATTGTVPTTGQSNNVTTIGGTNNHLFQTISSVIRNSNARNVTGIVDESLRIATPAPIREFVTGILNVVYCNGIRRLLGRC